MKNKITKKEFEKEYSKDELMRMVGGIAGGLAIYTALNVVSDAISGLSLFGMLSWSDIEEHRYEILDQLIAEKYFYNVDEKDEKKDL